MKTIHNIIPTGKLLQSIYAVQRRISEEFNVDRLVLYGSVARGVFDDESDVDILIVLKELPSNKIRNRISNVIFDINLEYDAIFDHSPD